MANTAPTLLLPGRVDRYPYFHFLAVRGHVLKNKTFRTNDGLYKFLTPHLWPFFRDPFSVSFIIDVFLALTRAYAQFPTHTNHRRALILTIAIV